MTTRSALVLMLFAACTVGSDPGDPGELGDGDADLVDRRLRCGDRICSSRESCSTCPTDCGVCEMAPDAGTLAPDASLAPDAPPPTTPPATILWQAGHETGNMSEWYASSGGGEFNSGVADSRASTAVVHGGQYAAAATITAPPESGVRLFRWRESRANREAYYSAWFYFPVQFTLTADPNTGRHWNLFQFKSRSADGRNDPLWAFYAEPDGKGGLKLRAGWGWGGTVCAGPFSTSGVGGKNFSQAVASIPVGRWVHFEAFLRQSKDFDGRLTFWQDGVVLFDFQNVRTSYDNPNYNSWRSSNEWAVNNYSDGLSPSPATIHIDDAKIATSRVGP